MDAVASYANDCVIPDLSFLRRFGCIPTLDQTPLTVLAQEIHNLGRIADIKARYIGEPCLLNNLHATITGAHLPFAVVVPNNCQYPTEKFAWTTVGYVMTQACGHFRT